MRASRGCWAGLVVLVWGCGGGGSTGTDRCVQRPLPAASGPGDVEALYPAAPGSHWFFERTGSIRTSGRYHLDVASSEPGGASVFRQTWIDQDGQDEEERVRVGGTGVELLSSSADAGTATAVLYPHQLLPFPAAPGTHLVQLECVGLDYGEDADGDGIHESMDVTSTVDVVGDETVEVAAGAFLARRVDTETVFRVKLSRGGTTTWVEGALSTWYAPGIGRVKLHERLRRSDGEVFEADEGLLGYEVGPARGGYVRHGRLETFPANGDVQSEVAASADADRLLIAYEVPASWAPSRILARFADVQGAAGPAFPLLDGSLLHPAAAFDGANHLVVGLECLPGEAPWACERLVGQRVTPAGALLDGAGGLAIHDVAAEALAVAPREGGGWLVLWRERREGGVAIGAVPVSAEGVVGAPTTVRTGTSTGLNELTPALAAGGGGFLATWLEANELGTRRIVAARLSAAGEVIGEPTIVADDAGQGWYFRPGGIAFDGTQFLVAWGDSRDDPDPSGVNDYFDLRAARITPEGELLDGPATGGGILVNAYPATWREAPAATWNGTSFVLAWTWGEYASTSGIAVARVTPDGAVLDLPVTGTGLQLEGTREPFLSVVTGPGGRTALVWTRGDVTLYRPLLLGWLAL